MTPLMTVPAELLPVCPVCGKPMTMNLRSDDKFVEDEGLHNAAKRYENFLRTLEGKVLLVQRLEAGDPETGGAYTIKKFTRNGAKVVLKARNPEVSDIVLENDAEYSTKYRAIAEFKGVVS
jgi:hypothetical protein